MKLHNILPEDLTRMNRLYDYCHGQPVDLSQDEKMILERVSFADDQLRGRKTDPVVIKLLKIKFPDISLATARNDLITAKYVFNSLSIQDKSYGLQLLMNMNLQVLDKAILDGDYKNVNALMKTRLELLKAIEATEAIATPPTANTYILQISLTGGRPSKFNIENVHELPAEDFQLLQSRIHETMIPKDIIQVLRKENEQ
jgi:hypothetical protein